MDWDFNKIKKIICQGVVPNKEDGWPTDRDMTYNIPRGIIDENWDKDIDKVSEGVALFLLLWNQPSLRFGRFSYEKLKGWIEGNKNKIEGFRRRKITSLKENDEISIEEMFKELSQKILAIKTTNKKIPRKSWTGVSKALHILAPEFFPLWDNHIFNGLKNKENFTSRTFNEKGYVVLCYYFKTNLEKYSHGIDELKNWYSKKFHIEKPILKILDEFYYTKYNNTKYTQEENDKGKM